ncbi:hypothetical protein ARC78_15305 [Stenotrophomonas pictorum JCM 9942]|uniref:Alkaline phosphatase n=1 Tax=Stenotrophomonas pictorum JCM 9942 TaxID=1236960 RepID=A0A0R0ABG1_9GAMM|nr:alkaline phosphatase D family protein [Stenotrophomonas pictorum]KRG38775.1 hypothetical protein ARC78_15305 [Stenotrophomonas pictorum JCM 9942]
MNARLVTRRQLLLGAGGLALLAGMAPRSLLAAPRLNANPFTLGVAAGDPLPDGFVIWTRLAPEPLQQHGGMPMTPMQVQWEIAEDEHFSRVVQRGAHIARPELGHSVHVEVAGLAAQRPYWYRFHLDDASSSIGRVRTAPAAGSTPDALRIAVAGCQHYEAGYFSAYQHLANDGELDALFHYGDYIYEGKAGKGVTLDGRKIMVREHLGEEIYDLADYRRRYAQYKSDTDLQAAHAAVAFIPSFDDHEVDNNWAGEFDQDGTPPEAFLLRRAAALQAWYENMPVRRAQLARPHGLSMHRRLDYGQLLRMHVLDTRSHRSDQFCGKPEEPHCRTDVDGEDSMLGNAQQQWLQQGLDNDARWNLIAQQVVCMPLDRRRPDATEPALSDDGWDGYPRSRARLIQAIQQRGLRNVVIATGDVHQHYVGHLPSNPQDLASAAVASEFVCTSISSNGDGGLLRKGQEHYLAQNPHISFNNAQRGYQIFDIRADRWSTELKVVDRVERPGGQLSTVARFQLSPDRPQPERI